MPWRNAQALHIFVPATQPMDNWVEQILGTVIRPLHEEFDTSIRWIWVTRYIQNLEQLPDSVKDHFSIQAVPDRFLLPGPYSYRYIVFRVSVEEDKKQTLYQRALQLVEAAGFYVVPWVDYDIVRDLGNNRFIHEGATEEERVHRARLVANFIDATVRLMLDSLIEENGQWKLEPNTHKYNPDGSLFQSMHHLFCNATDVPIFIHLQIRPSKYPVDLKYPLQF